MCIKDIVAVDDDLVDVDVVECCLLVLGEDRKKSPKGLTTRSFVSYLVKFSFCR